MEGGKIGEGGSTVDGEWMVGGGRAGHREGRGTEKGGGQQDGKGGKERRVDGNWESMGREGWLEGGGMRGRHADYLQEQGEKRGSCGWDGLGV